MWGVATLISGLNDLATIRLEDNHYDFNSFLVPLFSISSS